MPTPRRSEGRLRRLGRAASAVLIISGLLLLIDAGLTVLWQEPVSAVYAALAQRALEAQLEEASRLRLAAPEQRAVRRLATTPRRLAYLARRTKRRAREGRALGRIRARAAGIDMVMVHGTGSAALRKGPGHYPETAMPGEPGTVAVAGHRTTYRAPFRNLDDLRRGDAVRIEMPYGDFVYRVQRTRIVPPTALWVTRRVGYPRLVLTACHPLYSAAQRIVVFARLVSSRPSPDLA